jgi:hypothetical protein
LLSAEEVRSACAVNKLSVFEEKAALSFPDATLADAPTAADALRYALPRLVAQDFDDAVMLDGNYLRRADAEVKMGVLKA